MTLFVLHLTDGREQVVDADRCERQGAHWALVQTQLVMHRPRDVVRVRVPADEVVRVVELTGPPER